jgi:6-phospho-beta-glucosidase
MPEAAMALVAQVKVYERLTVRAAVEGSYEAALGALLAHPLIASYPAAKAILDGYVEGLPGLLPPLT